MKHKVNNLQNKQDIWTGVLESWEGCYCSRTLKSFTITKETKPTLKEIIYAANL